jgi:hypothetical protein
MLGNIGNFGTMNYLKLMLCGALVGGGVSLGLSFTALPILAVYGVVALSITAATKALGVYLYIRARQMRSSSRKDDLKLLGICVASIIVTASLTLLMNHLLAGIIATNLISAITGFISPVCTGLFVKTLNNLWESKYITLLCALAGVALGYAIVYPVAAVTYCAVAFVGAVYISCSATHQRLCNAYGCGYRSPDGLVVVYALEAAAIFACLSSAINYLFPDLMLALSWQTVLTYAATCVVTCVTSELLNEIVLEPAIEQIGEVPDIMMVSR